MSPDLTKEELTERPLVTIKEEIRLMEQFMKSETYKEFVEDFAAQYDTFHDIVYDRVPQTIGDQTEREQAIGATKWIEYAKTWFDTTLKALQHDLRQREHPPI